MAYQTPITIKDAITRIQKRKFVLPSIQREFVWNPDQIEQLFDSLMREYPISTFLLWKVDKSRIQDFQFYEFLKDYHEKNATHNSKADLSADEDVIAILDGQQRLTSLYIALRGSYAKKIPYYRWDSPHAFPKRKLYLNLLRPAEEMEMEYDFQFLTSDEAKARDGYWWFEVGQILDFDDISKTMQFLMLQGLMDTSIYLVEQTSYALNTLTKLFNIIHQKGTLSYFQEEGEALDKVLQIFIRINSGGTKLSYSDLLLSVATAQWREKDAREEIHRFVDEINGIGDGFNFTKDFVLKSCLVLGDFNDVRFKVDNFTKKNMMHIEERWDVISDAIRNAITLIAGFGFNRDNLTSTNAVIPIAYYLMHNERDASFLSAGVYADDRKQIRHWLVRTLLKRVFSGTPDALYPTFRNLIKEHLGAFPLAQIIERYKGTNKTIVFTEDDIENLLEIEYGSSLAYSALTLLYPGLNLSVRYHQDHVHPQRFFTDHKLRSQGIDDPNEREAYRQRFNHLPNLQLLPASENTEKNGKMLQEWLNEKYPATYEQRDFMRQHLFPDEVSLTFDNFVAFYEARKALLKAHLSKQLGVTTDTKTQIEA
ncbi:Uncharacterized conserved protein, contains ParB-like and HNH nuclease domains [Catalinimonas alkaloidigena]|uniref:Uncharacterized conserved protein, contains ParB-like and HNH nuclease domains n=1 Tax=Catalinimonas alkaloidigena TaxID=1075417 RepID=A0A1G9QJI2_9BACT|nr:DUF262 domain-containing protein [Catalinimonas alkaloidigena]SDM11156.1 Uncharacterized conserved protein, contains ParB-like and HNH nuclease domains [Catalinimonas alkaloidigena]